MNLKQINNPRISVQSVLSAFYWLFFLCLSFSLNAQTKSPKRGVGFDSKYLKQADIPALSPGMSWFYDWGNVPLDIAVAASDKYDIEYCPMAWNAGWNETKIRAYVNSHPNCKYILAYNEPNFREQANMTPAQAAADWPRLRSFADELGLKVISPACNYSAWTEWSTPKKWLDEFFRLVPIEQVDGIALHCYMGWGSALINYVKEYIGYYNKPIWLTEFCAWDDRHGTPDEAMQKIQREYLIETFDYLETEPMVARYAWFMAKTGENNSIPAFPWMQLLAGHNGSLTELGKVFNHMSSYDDSYFHQTETRIEAEHYIRMKGIYMEETIDAEGNLDVYDFDKEDALTYNVDVPKDGTYYFFFRYTSGTSPAIKIESLLNNESVESDLSNSGGTNTWATRKVSIPLKQGKQKIVITSLGNTLRINWLSISADPSFLEETESVETEELGNLSQGKPAFASSEQNHWQEGQLLATKATDGLLTTRWATEWEGANPDTENWFIADIESNDSEIKKIVIHWEAAFATAYEIYVSNNNQDWELIFSTTTGKGGVEEISVDPGYYRYVKWQGLKKATQYGYSFYEFQVWGKTRTGIVDTTSDNFSAYPNPVMETLSFSESCDVIVSDISGKKQYEAKGISSLDVSAYPTGTYILKIKTVSGKNYTKKITKAN